MFADKLRSKLRPWISRTPYDFCEVPIPDQEIRHLFLVSFDSSPPETPRHFIARYRRTGEVCGYVHYTEYLPYVFLCGGLCIKRSTYRHLSRKEREVVTRHGSLSRWLLNESISRLEPNWAVFAYTGNTASKRDGIASGFVETSCQHLIVQWHDAPGEERVRLIESVSVVGPF